MAENGDLQLLPERRKKIEIHVPGENRLLVLSLIAAVFVAALYFSGYLYLKSLNASIQGIDGKLKKQEESRDKTMEDKLFLLSKTLQVVSPIANSQNFWSYGLKHFTSLIEPTVQLDGLSVNSNDKNFSFLAYASNITTVAHQIAAFTNDDAFTDVTVGKISMATNGLVQFSMQVHFNPDKLVRQVAPAQ